MVDYNGEPSTSDHSAELVVYLFIWDRYRMIAKDFTLQLTNAPPTLTWLQCHERMARWFVLMDHRMKANGNKNFITMNFAERHPI